MKKKFCRPGRSAALLAKCYATDGPNQKSHKCVRECFNDYDWLHYDVEDDALTAPTHLDTVQTTLSTER